MEEVNSGLNNLDEEPDKGKSPWIYVISVFLLLLIIMMIMPYYSIRLDPEPKAIPSMDDIVPKNIIIPNESLDITSKESFLLAINPSVPVVKQTADRIADYSCKGNNICYAKAIFYFVRNEFDYINDPSSFEYVKSATESLATGNGDCDDASVLLANLLQAIGIRTRFVFVPGHVYIEAYMPETLKKYRNDGWVSMDATCEYCEFGEISYKYSDSEKIRIGG